MASPSVSQVPTINYLVPAIGNTHSVTVQGVFSATPFMVDWLQFSQANFKFVPQGCFVDNSQGTSPLVINIVQLNFNVTIGAGVSGQFQFPAPVNCTMNITGNGQASIVFVDFPVLPNAGQVFISGTTDVYITGANPAATLGVVVPPNSGGLPYQTQPQPFVVAGNTQALNVGTVDSNVTLDAGITSVRLVNDGSQTIFVAFNAPAVIPVPGTPASGFAMLPNSVETFTVAASSTVHCIASSGTNVLYITDGQGS